MLKILDGASNGSDSKKLRVEEAPPSRVLHIRKLPNEASETEVIALGLPFGKVTNILTLKGKNQVSGGGGVWEWASETYLKVKGWGGDNTVGVFFFFLCLFFLFSGKAAVRFYSRS